MGHTDDQGDVAAKVVAHSDQKSPQMIDNRFGSGLLPKCLQEKQIVQWNTPMIKKMLPGW